MEARRALHRRRRRHLREGLSESQGARPELPDAGVPAVEDPGRQRRVRGRYVEGYAGIGSDQGRAARRQGRPGLSAGLGRAEHDRPRAESHQGTVREAHRSGRRFRRRSRGRPSSRRSAIRTARTRRTSSPNGPASSSVRWPRRPGATAHAVSCVLSSHST